jgi:hypothetical protein
VCAVQVIPYEFMIRYVVKARSFLIKNMSKENPFLRITQFEGRKYNRKYKEMKSTLLFNVSSYLFPVNISR